MQFGVYGSAHGFFLRGQQLRNRYFTATGSLRFQGVYVSLIPSVTTQIAFQQRKLRGGDSAPELCLTWVAIHPLPLPFPTLPTPFVSLGRVSSENWSYTNVCLVYCSQTKTHWELFFFHMPLHKHFFLNESITKSSFLALNRILTCVSFSLCPIPHDSRQCGRSLQKIAGNGLMTFTITL